MPRSVKPIAGQIAKHGEIMELTDLISDIKKAAQENPNGMPAGYENIVSSLKDLNSGMEGKIANAITSLESIDDWLIEKNKDGKTNYELLAQQIGEDKLKQLIMLLNQKLGLDLEPDSLARGLKKLKKLDDGSSPDVADTGERRYVGEEYSDDYVHEEAKQPAENKPEEKKPVENKPEEKKPVENKPEEKNSSEKRSYDSIEGRKEHRQFSASLDRAAVGLKDKGLFGRRGSSDEHKALMDAFDELRGFSAHIVNETDKKDLALKNKIKALKKTMAAAIKYVEAKRKDAKVSPDNDTWEPRTPMGKNRYGAAMKLIEETEKELKRLHPDGNIQDMPEKPSFMQHKSVPEQTESEKDREESEIEQTAPEAEQAAPQKPQPGVEYLDAEGEPEDIMVLGDPVDASDKAGWAEKIFSIADQRPKKDIWKEKCAFEMLKGLAAVSVINDLDNQGVPADERTEDFMYGKITEKYNELLKEEYDKMPDAASKLNYARLQKLNAEKGDVDAILSMSDEEFENEGFDLESLPKVMDVLGLERKNVKEGPEQEKEDVKEEAQPENDIDPKNYDMDAAIKALGEVDVTAKNAKEEIFSLAATIVNLKRISKLGQDKMPTVDEFMKNTEKLKNDPTFTQTLTDLGGGTSAGALDRIKQNITKDDGRDLHGRFMQNSLHQKQQEAHNKKIQEDYAKQKALQNEQPKKDMVLGGNMNP